MKRKGGGLVLKKHEAQRDQELQAQKKKRKGGGMLAL